MFNHTCTLNIIISNIVLYYQCKEQIYFVINNWENVISWKIIPKANWTRASIIRHRLAILYVITTAKVHNFFLFFNQNLLKLSLTCFPLFFCLSSNQLFSELTSPLDFGIWYLEEADVFFSCSDLLLSNKENIYCLWIIFTSLDSGQGDDFHSTFNLLFVQSTFEKLRNFHIFSSLFSNDINLKFVNIGA